MKETLNESTSNIVFRSSEGMVQRELLSPIEPTAQETFIKRLEDFFEASELNVNVEPYPYKAED